MISKEPLKPEEISKFWFDSNTTIICPRPELTWVLTQGWLLIFSYFEARKKVGGHPRVGTQINLELG